MTTIEQVASQANRYSVSTPTSGRGSLPLLFTSVNAGNSLLERFRTTLERLRCAERVNSFETVGDYAGSSLVA
jgi:hypothetical protein